MKLVKWWCLIMLGLESIWLVFLPTQKLNQVSIRFFCHCFWYRWVVSNLTFISWLAIKVLWWSTLSEKMFHFELSATSTEKSVWLIDCYLLFGLMIRLTLIWFDLIEWFRFNQFKTNVQFDWWSSSSSSSSLIGLLVINWLISYLPTSSLESYKNQNQNQNWTSIMKCVYSFSHWWSGSFVRVLQNQI